MHTKNWAIPQLACLLGNLHAPDISLCLYVGFHFGCGAQLSLTKHCQVLESGSGYRLFYFSVGVYGMWGKTSELWFPGPVVTAHIIWKRRSCADKTPCWLSWCTVLWEQNTTLVQKRRENWREQWSSGRYEMLLRSHSGLGREGETQQTGSFQHRAGALEGKKCLQGGTAERQVSEVTERRRHSLGSGVAEQPKKPPSTAGMWRRTPPRRQTTGNLFASLLLISNSINRANYLPLGKTLLWLLTSVFQ